MPGWKQDPDSRNFLGTRTFLGPFEERVPVARGRGRIERDFFFIDHEVAVAHHTALQLEHPQPLRPELLVLYPGDDLSCIDRTLVAEYRSKERCDAFCVTLAKLTEHVGQSGDLRRALLFLFRGDGSCPELVEALLEGDDLVEAVAFLEEPNDRLQRI